MSNVNNTILGTKYHVDPVCAREGWPCASEVNTDAASGLRTACMTSAIGGAVAIFALQRPFSITRLSGSYVQGCMSRTSSSATSRAAKALTGAPDRRVCPNCGSDRCADGEAWPHLRAYAKEQMKAEDYIEAGRAIDEGIVRLRRVCEIPHSVSRCLPAIYNT